MKTGEVVSHSYRARDTHADAVKGVAIAALVLSHTLTVAAQTQLGVGLNRFITSWNMPLFFFISGWVMALQPPRTPLQTVGRRAQSLLVPYFAWICVLWVIGYPWSGGASGVGSWFQILLAPNEMWFLYCLFLADVLFAAVRAVGRQPAVVFAGVILLALAATVASRQGQGALLTLDNLGWLLPFLVAGYYGCRVSQRPPRLSALMKILLAGLALVLLSCGVGPDLLRVSMFGVWPFSLVAWSRAAAALANHSARYALAGAGIATLWQLMRLAPARGKRVMSKLGTATLGIYAMNSPLLTVLRLWFPAWSVTANPALSIFIVLLAALIVLGVEWLLTLMLRRIALTRRVLLGQRAVPSTSSGV